MCKKCGAGRPDRGGSCLACLNARRRELRKKLAPKLKSPAEVFQAYSRRVPKALLRVVERPGARVCRHCLRWRKSGEMGYRGRKGSGGRFLCWECQRAMTKRWRTRSRDKVRATAKRYEALRREDLALVRAARREAGERMTSQLSEERRDKLRRHLSDHAPGLSSERTRLAYFRGYAAGAQRSEQESKRFDALKDLVHRIASEAHGKWHTSYEDAVSAGYLAALNYLRKVTPEDPTHFRRKAAEAIRNGIIDSIRAVRGRAKSGGKKQPVSLEAPEETVAAHDTLEDHAWLEALDLHGREKRIVKLLAQGLNQRELGERLGVTESRANQLVKEIREKHGDRLLEALSA